MHRGLDPVPPLSADGERSTGAGQAAAHAPGKATLPEARPSGREPPVRAGLFDDIPGSIWTAFLAGWAGFFLLMWCFFAVDRSSRFMVTVAILFGFMAFGLPIVMARQTRQKARTRIEMVQTRTGPLSVRAAAAQIAMIPAAVVIGLLGFILFAK